MSLFAQIEGEKQCAKCWECKPLGAFSVLRAASDGRHSYCKECRNQQAKDRAMLGRRKDIKKRRPARTDIWPRALGEALLDVGARRWRYPVERAQLRWAA